MTRIHFAGVNTALLAAATEGRPVLVSYADILRRPGWWERELLPRLRRGAYPSVILDSGAFTVISTGLRIDAAEYARFAREYRDLFDAIVNLDDIAGDLATTWRNQATLESAGLDVMPVYHQGEPWAVLEHYLDRHEQIGVGLARNAGGRLAYGRAANAKFLREVFRRIRGRARAVRVHGFGLTRWTGFPFDTVDSTTWIAEYRGLRALEPYDDEKSAPTTTHGVAGDLANVTDWYTDAQLLELSLDSYAPTRESAGEIDADRLAEFTDWIENDARGQARTVFRRYGARRLAEKIDELDARICAAAFRPALAMAA